MPPIEILTAFIMVFLAEFLDKTQILVIVLASKFDEIKVFIGSSLALISVCVISCFIGIIMLYCIPRSVLLITVGITLIIAGIIFLVKREKIDKMTLEEKNGKNAFIYSYLAVFLAELGDKTQFAVITLSITCSGIAYVIIGSSLAFLVITLLGVMFGSRIKKLAEDRGELLSMIVSALFIILGIIFIASSLQVKFVLPQF